MRAYIALPIIMLCCASVPAHEVPNSLFLTQDEISSRIKQERILLHLDGILRSADGVWHIWLNGEEYIKGKEYNNIRIRAVTKHGADITQTRGNEQRDFHLEIGESYNWVTKTSGRFVPE